MQLLNQTGCGRAPGFLKLLSEKCVCLHACLFVCLYIWLSVRFGPREQMFKVVKAACVQEVQAKQSL